MSAFFAKTDIGVDTGDLAAGDSIAAYLVDASGTLITGVDIGGNRHLRVTSPSEFAEDSAHVSGDYGQQVLAVRNDTEGSLVGANGDYAPLQVDSLGRLRVNADINVANDFVYAEDSAAVSGDLGASVLLVRQDTLASSTSADGDYGNFKSTSLGELYVADSTARTSLASILSELQSITFAEDSAHVSGDAGVMSLAVRNDTLGSLVSANGDYAPLQVNASGALYVAGTVAVGGQYAEDSAAVSGDIGLFMLAQRHDATTSTVSANEDYSALHVDALGRLKTLDRMDTTILQQVVTIAATATAVPAAALANRHYIMINNRSGTDMFIGSATVTAAGATQGIRIGKNESMGFDLGPNVTLYAIVASGTADLNVLELA